MKGKLSERAKPCYDGSAWKRLIATDDPGLPEADVGIGEIYDLQGRSLVLFERVD